MYQCGEDSRLGSIYPSLGPGYDAFWSGFFRYRYQRNDGVVIPFINKAIDQYCELTDVPSCRLKQEKNACLDILLNPKLMDYTPVLWRSKTSDYLSRFYLTPNLQKALALCLASYFGKIEAVKALYSVDLDELAHWQSPYESNICRHGFRMAFFFADMAGHRDIVSFLLGRAPTRWQLHGLFIDFNRICEVLKNRCYSISAEGARSLVEGTGLCNHNTAKIPEKYRVAILTYTNDADVIRLLQENPRLKVQLSDSKILARQIESGNVDVVRHLIRVEDAIKNNPRIPSPYAIRLTPKAVAGIPIHNWFMDEQTYPREGFLVAPVRRANFEMVDLLLRAGIEPRWESMIAAARSGNLGMARKIISLMDQFILEDNNGKPERVQAYTASLVALIDESVGMYNQDMAQVFRNKLKEIRDHHMPEEQYPSDYSK